VISRKTKLKILFLAALIVVMIVLMSGCCTLCSNTPVATPRAPTATPGTPAAPSGEQIWDNGNVYAITGSSKSPTIVTFSKPVTVTYINTYHWNGAKGATPGTIALKAADGTMYGPWQATGADGQGGVKNAYWVVQPNVGLKAGSYTIVDSDPSTFATNNQANGVGMAHVKYTITA
jgi:hypothetical protein